MARATTVVATGAAVLAAGYLLWWVQIRNGEAGAPLATGIESPAGPNPQDRDPLARLRDAIAGAPPTPVTADDSRLARARAWVAANRPADWPYAELEARSLATFEARLDGVAPTLADLITIEHQDDVALRALDVDGDGRISEEELVAFAAYIAQYDSFGHPYVRALLDTDGDGSLSAAEQDRASQLRINEIVMRGMAERARLDRFDLNADGVLSETELAAGDASMRSHILIHTDSRGVEWVDSADGQTDAQQDAAIKAIRSKRGDYWAEDAKQSRDDLIRQALTRPTLDGLLGETLSDPEAVPIRPDPPQPDPRDYGADENGSITDDTQLDRFITANQQWEIAIHHRDALVGAERTKAAFERATSQFDIDGDGRLIAEEWAARRETLVLAAADRLYLLHYDLDHSGRVDPREVEIFLAWYRADSLRADVNGDARVDALDLQAMADAYQRQNPRGPEPGSSQPSAREHQS